MFWDEPGPHSEYTLSIPVVILALETYKGIWIQKILSFRARYIRVNQDKDTKAAGNRGSMEFTLRTGWFGSAVESNTPVDEWVENAYGAHSPTNRGCRVGECFRSMSIP
jgi:hypothetical protein